MPGAYKAIRTRFGIRGQSANRLREIGTSDDESFRSER